MPTVRAYEQQVDVRPLPNVGLSEASAADFGAGVGQGLQSLGGEVRQYENEQRQKKVETDVTAALNKLDGYSANGIRQSRDPKNGIRGESVREDTKRFMDDFEKRQSDIASTLTDPEAQRVYQMRVGGRRNSYTDNLMTHADGVVLNYQNNQDQATAKLADERISLAYDNPIERQKARVDKVAAVDRQAERNDWSPERKQLEMTQALSSSHMTVLRGYLDNKRMTEAEAYLRSIPPSEMTDKDRSTAQETVAKSNDAQKAQSIADQAHTLVRAGMLEPTDVEGWIKEQTGDKVELRDNARSRFNVLDQGFNNASRATVDKTVQDALRILHDSNGDITKVNQDPNIVGTLMTFDPAKVKTLEKIAANWKEDRETDGKAWLDMRSSALNGTLAKMRPDELYAQYHDRFSKAEWDSAVKLWADAKESAQSEAKKSAWDEVTSGYRTERQAIDDALRAQGFDPKLIDQATPGTEEAKAAAFLATTLDRALAGEKANQSAALGKKVTNLNPKDIDRVVGDVLKTFAKPGEGKGVMPWNWFNNSKGVAVTTDTQKDVAGRMAFGINEVPAMDQVQIRAAYRAKYQREPNTAEIVSAYNQLRAK